jgi:hypothetical protein
MFGVDCKVQEECVTVLDTHTHTHTERFFFMLVDHDDVWVPRDVGNRPNL